MKKTQKKLMSVPEVAEAIGCHPLTLRRMIAKKEIPVYKLLRDYRLDLDEVLRALRENAA